MTEHIFKATNRSNKCVHNLPYRGRRSLLSEGELRFFHALHEAVGERWGISIKTRLADVILCPPKLWSSPHGRRLAQKHVDFVLYDTSTASIAAAIELDDKTHEREERVRRDDFLDEALAAAGVLLFRVAVSPSYQPDSIRCYIERSLRPRRRRVTRRRSDA